MLKAGITAQCLAVALELTLEVLAQPQVVGGRALLAPERLAPREGLVVERFDVQAKLRQA